jgi:reductive dehalogenase
MSNFELRIDERDTMFARMARTPGTPEYAEYYGRHPERQATDDHLRALPPLCEPGGRCYEAAACGEAAALFRAIETIHIDRVLVDQWAAKLRQAVDGRGRGDTATLTLALKDMARQMGALAAGCAQVTPAVAYTHKGRFSSDYGEMVPLDCPSALVFLVEMDIDEMRRAPGAPAIRESARQYLRASRIAKTVADALRASGFRARPHYDAHYDVMLPPLAVAAGLGELGRNNILVADRAGARVRIGAVTTDALLEPGQPVSLGVRAFCEVCRKCADNCPSRALEAGAAEMVRGVRKWPTDAERCYGYWRVTGTDCGICMAVCPFSHRDTWFHALVRQMVRAVPASHRAARFFDDLVYGHTWGRWGR